MKKTMKAAVVREFGKPLTIEDVPIPQPGPGQVLVKVQACRVCGTDLHAAGATGRSNRLSRSSLAMRASGTWRLSGPV